MRMVNYQIKLLNCTLLIKINARFYKTLFFDRFENKINISTSILYNNLALLFLKNIYQINNLS